MATKRIFLSDIHLSAQSLYTSGDARYKPAQHRPRLLNFIQNHILARANRIKDVVLLGDIFDTWTCPPDVEPPSYQQIFEDNPHEMQAFQAIIDAGIKLWYVHGNHDFDLNATELKAAIPNIQVIRSYLGAGRSHAEHGHQHTLFNSVDFRSDRAFGRPIGYYIARAATRTEHSGQSISDILSYLEDVLEAGFTSQTLPSSIVEAITERAGMNPQDSFTLPGCNQITVQAVKDRYAGLTDHYTGWRLFRRIFDELGRLSRVADTLCEERSYNVVVFGHTHKAKIDKDSWFVEDRIYANTGAWCQEDAHCVEIDKGRSTLTVRLHEVDDNGRIKDTQRESL